MDRLRHPGQPDNRERGKNRGAIPALYGGALRPCFSKKTVAALGAVFAFFLVPFCLAAQENHELTLANLYYDADDYAKACTHFQNLILWHGEAGFSGTMFYRYAYSHERLRGLDATALKIYALSLYYFRQEGRPDSPYARYAAGKLKSAPPDPDSAAALLEELRAGIDEERKTLFYRRADRIYSFFSRFSLFQWKIIASLAMTIPLFAGILILQAGEKLPKKSG
ncbi:MAG: hypothetical protein LBO76_01330 [Treponema sp.]|jgi:hypothetical protein|nr:hypothetical protein [Treponema sp.]